MMAFNDIPVRRVAQGADTHLNTSIRQTRGRLKQTGFVRWGFCDNVSLSVFLIFILFFISRVPRLGCPLDRALSATDG
jgi:hypothetical protein